MTLARQFHNGTTCAKGNHTVTEVGESMVYLLHGHVIARWAPIDGTFELRHAGHASVTTAKALNAILAEFDWLPFTLKAWVLTDTRTGRKLAFPADGGFVSLRRVKANDMRTPAQWCFADDLTSGNAPALGGR